MFSLSLSHAEQLIMSHSLSAQVVYHAQKIKGFGSVIYHLRYFHFISLDKDAIEILLCDRSWRKCDFELCRERGGGVIISVRAKSRLRDTFTQT